MPAHIQRHADTPWLSPLRYTTGQVAFALSIWVALLAVATWLACGLLRRLVLALPRCLRLPRDSLANSVRVLGLAGFVYYVQTTTLRCRYPPSSRRDFTELAVVEFEPSGRPPNGVDSLSDLLHQHALTRQPLLVRGGVGHWPAVDAWTPEYLRSQLGGHTPITLSENRPHVTEEIVESVDTHFGAFVRWLQRYSTREAVACYQVLTGHGPFYIAEAGDFTYGVQELEEVDAPWVSDVIGSPPADAESWSFLPNALIGPFRKLFDFEYRASFWLGGIGVRTHWHLDAFDNFNVLVHLRGEKNVSLAHVSSGNAMYPQTDQYSYLTAFSHVDRWAPDMDRFPDYASVRVKSVLLRPGDVLLIPQGWWHAAETLTHAAISLSVRYFWCWDWWTTGPAWQELLEWLHDHGMYMHGRSMLYARRFNTSQPVLGNIPVLHEGLCRPEHDVGEQHH